MQANENEETIPESAKDQKGHNHPLDQPLQDLKGYFHDKRSTYCRQCKRETKSDDPRAADFNLDTCFAKQEDQQMYERNELDYYFDSYSHFNIHEDMLKDVARTKTYMNAILKNKHLFEDKIVLDVGCGTGILSIFAAKAGAKHVFGVDNANIAVQARQIVAKNGLADKITIIQGLIEEVELPVEKVDVIISEWMGYFLLYESMLDCVLDARDKYLAPGGLLFPDKAQMFITSFCSDDIYKQRFDFWNDIYGVDMSCIKGWVFAEPLIDEMDRSTLNGDIVQLIQFDLQTIQKKDLNFVADYSFKIRRNDYIQGVAIWWDVLFCHGKVPLKISTSPFASSTHWKQAMFFIKDQDIPALKGDTLQGKIAVKKCPKNARDLDVKVSFQLDNPEISFNHSQIYKMN